MSPSPSPASPPASTPSPRPSLGWLRRRLVERLTAARRRLARSLEPGPRAAVGVRWATTAVVLATGALVGLDLATGLGRPVDALLGALLAWMLARFGLLLWRLGRSLLGQGSRFLTSSGIAALLGVGLVLAMGSMPVEVVAPLALLAVTVNAILGASVALLTAPGGAGRRRPVAVAAVVLAVAADGWMVWGLLTPGSKDHQPAWRGESVAVALPPDPGMAGPRGVHRLTYGSGRDRHREEFATGVDLTTGSVDATPFVGDGVDGWKLRLRRLYWGFGLDELPLNGRVWVPGGEGPFPVVLVVHGNHNMMDYSDPGYAYLGEHLASRGFVTVSVDENFLNGGALVGGLGEENDARAWLLLEHLAVLGRFAGRSGHPLTGKLDLDRVALVGHSRGGEAAAVAAAFNRLGHYPDDAMVTFDYRFGIRAVAAIAPADGQYRPADTWTSLADVSYLVLQGGHDSDVFLFLGDRQYRRVSFSPGFGGFKASLYAHAANHGQFNTVWGARDLSGVPGWLINRRPLLSGAAQRDLGRTVLTAFLEATLHGDSAYRELFRDPGVARAWLPDTATVSRYRDATYRPLVEFTEDVDVTTGGRPGVRLEGEGLAVWREEDVPLRGGSRRRDRSAVVGWRKPEGGEGAARFTLRLPPGGAGEPAAEALFFELAALDEEPPAPEGEGGWAVPRSPPRGLRRPATGPGSTSPWSSPTPQGYAPPCRCRTSGSSHRRFRLASRSSPSSRRRATARPPRRCLRASASPWRPSRRPRRASTPAGSPP